MENSSSQEKLPDVTTRPAKKVQPSDSSENSGDEQQAQLLQQIDEEQAKRKEEQNTHIIEMLRKEFEKKERQKQRKAAVKGMFADEEEAQKYGYTEKVLKFMTKSIRSYYKELRIKEGQLKKEADLVKVDDTWLKMTKMMFEPFRIPFQNERIETWKIESPEEFQKKALIQIAKKRDLTRKAGEMICTYLELDPEKFLRNRQNGEPTIMDNCDPV